MAEASSGEGNGRNDRANCIQALRGYHREEVPLLRNMADSFPEEIIVRILEFVARDRIDDTLYLQRQNDLHRASAKVLSTQIAEAAPYRQVLERTILESIPIRLELIFAQADRAAAELEVVAQLPAFSTPLLPHIRTLVARLNRRNVTSTRSDSSLMLAINGMADLASQLSPYTLHGLIVEIALSGSTNPNLARLQMSYLELMLDHRNCFLTPTQRCHNRTACEHLVEAIRTSKLSRACWLKIDVLHPSEHRDDVELKVARTLITETRSAFEIVERAVQNSLAKK